MMLGRVLEGLDDETFATEALIALDDLALMVEVTAAGRNFGETPGQYAAGASRRFTQLASDEDWLALMTAIGHAGDSGMACLKYMLAWSLERDSACSCNRS